MHHLHRFLGIRREERRAHGDVANIAPGYAELSETLRFERLARHFAREDAAPDLGPLFGVGKRELDDKSDSAQKRRVERAFQVRRENRKAAIAFHALQQVTHLDIREAVVAVLHLTSLS